LIPGAAPLEGSVVLYAIARLAIAAPRRVIAVAVLVMVGTAIFGIPVITSLSAGGMGDPTSESALAARLLRDKFDQADMEMLITVTSDGGAQSPRATAVGTDLVQRLQNSPNVGRVVSPWTAPPSAVPALISMDGKTGLIMAGIFGGETDAQKTPSGWLTSWSTTATASRCVPAGTPPCIGR